MRFQRLLIVAAIGWLASLQAADVVELADGDRLSGTVQKLENGKLFFKSKYADSPLQIDWALVSAVTTESEIKMTFQDGRQETRTLPAVIMPQMNVVALEPHAPEEPEDSAGWLRRMWDNSSLSADFGQSYSGSAGYNQLSSNSEIDYAGDRWDGTFVTHFDYYGVTASNGSTYQSYGRLVAERYVHGDHFFLFPYAFLGRQTTCDGGRGQMRQYGGGAGWTFRRRYSDQVSLYAGLVRSIASGFTMLTEELRADVHLDEPLFVAAISWDKKLAHKITTSVQLYYYKPPSEAGHHSLATDASAKVPLYGPAYFTIRVYDTPELRQRQLFSTKNLQVSSGIGIEF